MNFSLEIKGVVAAFYSISLEINKSTHCSSDMALRTYVWLCLDVCSFNSQFWLQVGFQIRSRVQELGHGCIYLVQKAGALQLSPTDSFSKRELIEYARAVTEKVREEPSTALDYSNEMWDKYLVFG